ncbi:MAG: DUF2809 domain-containing protein [Bacteroidota bacterium]
MGKRKAFVISISIFVGLLHFIISPNYQGPFPVFINSYLIDILLPFSLYYLFTLSVKSDKKIPVAIIVFLIGFSVETFQYFNIHVFGSTFDPVDYLMYALGVFSALIFDYTVVAKWERTNT